MLNCLIVDDEPLARNLISEYVSKIPYLKLITTCSNALAAMEVLRTEQIDVLFLDIQMPELTGISLLKTLQKKPLVVLTTAYSQYALEGYELDVVDYLLKPITFERFLKAVDKINNRVSTQPVEIVKTEAPSESSYVFVKDGTRLVKVFISEILYVEGLKDYVTIHTKTQKVITLQRLKALEEILPADKFMRIHHSYIIALHAIDSVQKGEVKIGNTLIPISESYKKAFKDYVESRQMGS
jgi:two-component system, LytTR family, response regulator